MKNWNNIKEVSPTEGAAVLILLKEPVIAYFCDGGFYSLELDERLGVLRKTYIKEPVEYWADYIVPAKE